MFMRYKSPKRESGQTLVVVALSMTVLMLMAGLAVDVGMAYNERRNMQNAADAAALAGAQQLCDMQGTSAALAAAREAGMLNGATTITPTLEAGDTRIRAVAGVHSETSFFRILGIDDVPVSATAVAECGCAAALGGAWPILFDDLAWFNDLGCLQRDGSWSPVGKSPHFIVWADGNADTYLGQDLCTLCNCAPIASETGISTVMTFGGNPFMAGNRGWAQLGSPDVDLANDELEGLRCNGAATLKTWMYWGYPGLLDGGQCISTETGTVASALDEALDGYHDNLLRDVNILLFDHDDRSCTAGEATFDDCNTGLLRISGTGGIHIDRIYLQGDALSLTNLATNPYDGRTSKDCRLADGTTIKNRKAILATRLCYTVYTGSGTSGGLPDATCVNAVSLVE